MFTARFFAQAYFAPHYFAEFGAEPSLGAGGDLDSTYFVLQRMRR